MNQISQKELINFIKTNYNGKYNKLYNKNVSIFINTDYLQINSTNLLLQNIDSEPVSLETNPIICCTNPDGETIETKNFYNKTHEQHIKQHIQYINGRQCVLDVPIIKDNIITLHHLNFTETLTTTSGIPFKNTSQNKQLFDLFRNNDVIASWGQPFNKSVVNDSVIFAKIEDNDIVEVYLIINSDNNSVFDNTFKETIDKYLII
jgi:hypothetical protein